MSMTDCVQIQSVTSSLSYTHSKLRESKSTMNCRDRLDLWKSNSTLFFSSCSECANIEQILERQVLRARVMGLILIIPAVRCENRTRDGWVRSANATSVLCRPPNSTHLMLAVKKNIAKKCLGRAGTSFFFYKSTLTIFSNNLNVKRCIPCLS